MSSRILENAWHFSPVIELNNLLSSRAEGPQEVIVSQLPSILVSSSDDHQNPPGLGNFDKIWNYLSLPLSIHPVKIEPLLEVTVASAPTEDLSDKSITNRGVRWWDGTESADLPNEGELASKALAINLAKGFSKKERRRTKQEEIERGCSPQKVLSNGTERAFGDDRRQPNPRSTSEAVIQQILYDLTRLGTPYKASRPTKKSRRASDREISLLAPLRPLRGSVAALNTFDQTVYSTAAERKEHLMKKLRLNFAEENEYLDNIPALPRLDESEDSNLKCIHVFVDASNIMIGFQDSFKRSRGIPISKRIRLQPFSYHNLSLVLERGRPTAKRVLVGSDKFPAIQEAKLIGYETNILERVHKAKELTPRQKKYINNYNSSSYNSTTGQSSSSETTTGFALEKWVEQAVDEILHLKMLESVVDAKTPSTIVLATGDAAEAEYSQGFLKMVERALKKGWKVELVSFKHNISGAYKRKEFREKWESQFKIITLDEYVDSLVGSEA